MSNFDKLASKIAAKEGLSKQRADAIAAAIGRRKYGAATMAKASARGVPASSIRK